MAKSVKAIPQKSVAAKATLKKPVTSKQAERTIKYTDKSAGQPELTPVFDELRKILLKYVNGPVKLATDSGGQLHLYSNKPVEILGRKKDQIYFASLLIQKGYVGFYFMPVYTDIFLKKEMAPELLKCLKGKACFHIKSLDGTLIKQIKHALTAGYECYKKKGWV